LNLTQHSYRRNPDQNQNLTFLQVRYCLTPKKSSKFVGKVLSYGQTNTNEKKET